MQAGQDRAARGNTACALARGGAGTPCGNGAACEGDPSSIDLRENLSQRRVGHDDRGDTARARAADFAPQGRSTVQWDMDDVPKQTAPKPKMQSPKELLARQVGAGTKDKRTGNSLKVKLRGRDGAPLRPDELQQGFYELGCKLAAHGNVRFKWATVYLTAIDENGQEIRLDKSGEWTLHPYVSAADEFGL